MIHVLPTNADFGLLATRVVRDGFLSSEDPSCVVMCYSSYNRSLGDIFSYFQAEPLNLQK